MGDIRVARLGVGSISPCERFDAGFSSPPIERWMHMFWDWGDPKPLANVKRDALKFVSCRRGGPADGAKDVPASGSKGQTLEL